MDGIRKAIMTKSVRGVPDDSLGILNIIRTCQNYNTLPRGGGLLDQDSLFVYILFNVSQWDQARAQLDEANSKRNS